MIFKSIRLKNFRQYKNDYKFDFAIPGKDKDKDNITLLIAANGVGKTTLLQAFRYCFYGKSSNYLNLPKPDELINNTLVEDLKDLDETQMFVEVTFTHEGKDFIARRETTFIKNKNVLKETNEEHFSLSELEERKGYKPYKESEANDKIRSILPEGLSQVFMFDGERMERNISDRAFSNELKESILGILDIKKYDKLIDILGFQAKASSVIGMLSSKKKTSNEGERALKDYYNNLLKQKNDLLIQKEETLTKIDEYNQKIQINKDQQKKLEDNKSRAIERDKIDSEIVVIEDKLNDCATRYIKTSKYALLYKMLLINKNKYDDFINTGKKHSHFYSNLHVNTIQDIQDSKVCVCGRPVAEHTNEFKRLEELKLSSLPIESAQHLNYIDQKFKQAAEYNDIMSKLETLRLEIKTHTKNIVDKREESSRYSQEILKIEKQLGLTNQSEIEDLISARTDLYSKMGSIDTKISILEEAIKRQQKKVDLIDKNNGYNQKINKVIEVVQNIKSKLETIKNDKDKIARDILSEKFNFALSKTIQGNYHVDIDNKYAVRIMDKGNNKDVTTSLSTGQNVVISLTFINALIATAKHLSDQINKNEKYSVIMDAALSNLDEVHIDRLCKNTINNMDQLIFLSFKRQLRDEMYQGIKQHIGKAFVINKHDKGHVLVDNIELETLDEYIHTFGEEE